MKEMQFSKAAQNYPPSGIRKMFDLAAKYPDAIKLTVGEPNFDTPAYIKEAAKKAMDAGETHYTPNAGMTVLRQAVAEKYQKGPIYRRPCDGHRGRHGEPDADYDAAAGSR